MTKIYSCDVLEGCAPIRFHKDNTRFYMETNKGSGDLSRLVLFDPQTGKEELFESDPLNRVVFGAPVTDFSAKNFGVVASQGNSPRQIQFGLKLIR